MPKQNVLIAEDEELMRSILRQLFEGEGYRVFTADSAESASEIFAANDIHVTLTDIKMGGRDGLALLDHIKSVDADALVVIMTAFSSVETAVAALRKGAYDYVTKPFVNEDLIKTVRNALEYRRLFQENRTLRRELSQRYDFAEMIGTSAAHTRVLEMVKKVAATSATVLIQGESGTGKELVARSLHFNSDRAAKPFLAVNCGALPESLLESELFGHVKGSFTGAVSDSKGLFRSTAGGTLFLDEIGEMPPSLQVKLLRALQESEVTPVGSSKSERFDARVIVATNKKLDEEVAAGRFREDLYYRINVVEITLPPLRERREDIPLLAKHFVGKAARMQRTDPKTLTDKALAALTTYTWPGNIRELQNTIERAVIMGGPAIDVENLPEKMRSLSSHSNGGGNRSLEAVEHDHIMKVMDSVEQDKARAAEILEIDLSTLYRKLKRYGSR